MVINKFHSVVVGILLSLISLSFAPAAASDDVFSDGDHLRALYKLDVIPSEGRESNAWLEQYGKIPRSLGPRAPLSDKVDLRTSGFMPDVYNQGKLNSCTANALAGCMEFDLKKQGNRDFTPSRLFIYWGERNLEDDTPADAGASLSDGIRFVIQRGVCHEGTWPYIPEKFYQTPPRRAFEQASKFKDLDGFVGQDQVSLDSVSIKKTLAANIPVAISFKVYESFEYNVPKSGTNAGLIPMPNLRTEKYLGNHAVMLVGYDSIRKYYIVRNSWGTKLWGERGYGYMPFGYLDKGYIFEAWKIQRVSNQSDTASSFVPGERQAAAHHLAAGALFEHSTSDDSDASSEGSTFDIVSDLRRCHFTPAQVNALIRKIRKEESIDQEFFNRSPNFSECTKQTQQNYLRLFERFEESTDTEKTEVFDMLLNKRKRLRNM